MTQIKTEIHALLPEIILLRRQLHQNPELSLKEYQTADCIEAHLDALSIPHRRVAPTGVVADLIVNPDYPTTAIRAEIDALPITDEKAVPSASRTPGVSHACGHDGITALTLGLARLLSAHRDALSTNIRFLFEPAEETGRGARLLIDGGALESPKPDQLIIFHFANSEPFGMEIQREASTATVAGLKIEVTGSSGHWAESSLGNSAVSAAASLLCAIEGLNATAVTQKPFIIGFGTISGGVKSNVIPDTCAMEGTLRAFTESDFDLLFSSIRRMAENTEKRTGTQIRVSLSHRTPAVINDPRLIQKGCDAGRAVFGGRCVLSGSPFLVGDNAGWYFKDIPGLRIVFFAAQNTAPNYPIHHPKFDFNEGIFGPALEMLYRMLLSL